MAGPCHSLNAVVSKSHWHSGRSQPRDLDWMRWLGKSQAGMEQVPTPQHKQAHACLAQPASHLQQIFWQELSCFLCSAEEGERAISRWG